MTKTIPTYQNLFGTDNYYTVSDSRSILSPASYLVELLKLVESNIIVDENSGGVDLKTRRPDIYAIKLNENNTMNEQSKLSIVNNILKNTINPNNKDIEDLKLTDATYPFDLPYNKSLQAIRQYLAQNKLSLQEIWKNFNEGYRKDSGLSQGIALETLGISSQQWAQYSTDPATGELYKFFGFSEGTSDEQVVSNITNVQTFLTQTGLDQKQLQELVYEDLCADEIKNNYQKKFYINLKNPKEAPPVSILGAAILGLTVTNAGRIMRFVRMAQAIGWSFTDLDWALQNIRPLIQSRDEALPYLAWIQEQVKKNKLSVNQCCGFLGQIKNYGMKNGNCFYDTIFNNPNNPKLPSVPSGSQCLTWNVPSPGSTVEPSQTDKEIESALAADLQLNQSDLITVAVTIIQYAYNNNYELQLNSTNMALLYRMSLLSQIINKPLKDIFTACGIFDEESGDFLKMLVLTQDLYLNTLCAVSQVNKLFSWLEKSTLSLGQLEFITLGRSSDTLIQNSIISADAATNFINQLSSDVSKLLVSKNVLYTALQSDILQVFTTLIQMPTFQQILSKNTGIHNQIITTLSKKTTEYCKKIIDSFYKDLQEKNIISSQGIVTSLSKEDITYIETSLTQLFREYINPFIYNEFVNGLGLLQSADGKTWTQVTDNSFPAIAGIAFLINLNNTNFAGTVANGLWASADGKTWTPVTNIPATAGITCLNYLNNTYFAGTAENGLWLSTDGQTWTQVTNIPATAGITCLNYLNNTYFAGTAENGLWSSADGKTWTQITNITIAFLTYLNNTYFAGSVENGFWSSTDAKTWTQVTTIPTTAGITCLNYLNNTYFAGSVENGLWFSTDGQTWTQVTDIPATASIAFLNYLDNTYFAGSVENGLWSSTDGKTWTQEANIPATAGITCLNYLNNTYFAGTAENGLWSSTDGKTWTQVTDIPATAGITCLNYLNNTYFAGSVENGLWSSTDGKIWTQVTDILTTAGINCLAYLNNTYFAGLALSLFQSNLIKNQFDSLTDKIIDYLTSSHYKQQEVLIHNLSGLYHTTASIAAILQKWGNLNLNSLLGTTSESTQYKNVLQLMFSQKASTISSSENNIVKVLQNLQQAALLITKLSLSAAEAEYFKTIYIPTSKFPILDDSIKDVWEFKQLIKKYSDSQNNLLNIIQETDSNWQTSLAKLTAWDTNELSLICGEKYLNITTPSIKNIYILNKYFSTAKELGIKISSLWALRNNNFLSSSTQDDNETKTLEEALLGGLNAQFKNAPDVLTKIQNKLNENLRDKLVSMAAYKSSTKLANYGTTPRGLYAYFLIDVELSGVIQTSCIREAISAVQLYIYRCLNQLEPGTNIKTNSDLALLWQWMHSYREWQANMEVFLYPENYIEPELRDQKTELFSKAEAALKQADLTNPDNIEGIFKEYMNGLEILGNLKIISASVRTYTIEDEDNTEYLNEYFFVGMRPSEPGQYYYRVSKFMASASDDQLTPFDWGQWQKISLTINTIENKSGHYGVPKPIFAFGCWYLFWAEQQKSGSTTSNNNSNNNSTSFYKNLIKYSYLDFNKNWVAPHTLYSIGPVSNNSGQNEINFPNYFDYKYLSNLDAIPGLNENVYDFAEFNGKIYAATGNSLYTYKGGLWSKVTTNIINEPKTLFVYNNILYVGSNLNGLYTIDLNGNENQVKADNAPKITTTSVNCMQNFNGDLYVGIGIVFGGLYKLDNAGNWSRITGGNPPAANFWVLCLTEYNNLLYVGIDTGGLYTIDTNGNWNQVNADNSDNAPPTNSTVNCIQSFNGELYVGIGGEGGYSYGALYKMDVNGNWQQIEVPYSPSNYWVQGLTVLNNLLYVGIGSIGVYAVDANENWTPIDVGFKFGININKMIVINGLLYFGDDVCGKIYATNSQLLMEYDSLPLAMNGNTTNDNIAKKWEKVIFNDCFTKSINYFNNTYFAGTAKGLWKSYDGENWSQVTDIPTTASVNCFAYCNNIYFAGIGGDGLWKSNDGENWSQVQNFSPTIVEAIAYFNNTYFVGTSYNGGLWKSNDGENWSQVQSFSPPVVLSIAPFSNSIFAGTQNGLWKSNDGENWSQVQSIDAMNVDALVSFNNSFLAGTSNGLWISGDGENWSQVNSYSSDIIINIAYCNNICFIAAGSDGLLGSKLNDGNNENDWIKITDLPSSTIMTFANFNNIYFVGTDNGLWILKKEEYLKTFSISPDGLNTICIGDTTYQLTCSSIGTLSSYLNGPQGINSLLKTKTQSLLDFSNKNAMKPYCWELFFYLPFLIANELSKQQQFAAAKLWYEYIFNPVITKSDDSGNNRYWQFLGLRTDGQHPNKTLAEELSESEYEELRKDLNNKTELYASDSDPFDPDIIARLRPIAYQKTIVMHYISNLLNWGDMLYRENTRESINEAEMLYVLAYNLLGEQPEDLGPEKLSNPDIYNNIFTGANTLTKLSQSVTSPINCIASYNDSIFIGCQDGLYLFTNGVITQIELPQICNIQCLQVYNNKLYIGTNNGLLSYDSNGQWEYYGKNENVMSLAISSENILLCGTFNQLGLLMLNNESNSLQLVNLTAPTVGNSTPNVYALKDLIYVADQAIGLYYFPSSKLSSSTEIETSLVNLLEAKNYDPGPFQAYNNRLYFYVVSLKKVYVVNYGNSIAEEVEIVDKNGNNVDIINFASFINYQDILFASINNVFYVLCDNIFKPVKEVQAFDGNTQCFGIINSDLCYIGTSTGEIYAIEPYFGIPRNEQFLSYWDEVKQRIYNIRNGLTITGQTDNLPLFSPPINPMDMVEAIASGESIAEAISSINSAIPYYRFDVMIAKAKEMAANVVSFGQALLVVLETKDAQKLADLYNKNQSDILSLTQAAKQDNLQYAQNNINALNQGLISAQNRQSYYAGLINTGLSAGERSQIALAGTAITEISAVEAIRTAAMAGYSVPTIFGFSDGGFHPGDVINQGALILDGINNILNQSSNLAGVIASYQRRLEDWTLQGKLAQNDIDQIKYQIVAAQCQQDLAKQEIILLQKQTEQQKKVAEFYKTKFTNEQLYNWYIGQLSGLYFQAYHLALDMALQAENAWKFEHIGLPLASEKNTFIKPAYWNSLYEGLLSGESLHLDLQRMEKAYLDQNLRRFEISKTISLANFAPEALDNFITKGHCMFDITENDFAWDYPEHYCRKIKSISISIPMVVGPYQNIHATLIQTGSKLINSCEDDGQNAVKYLLNPGSNPITGANTALQLNLIPNEQIVLSQGVNDTGMFELNFNDPRYLPFEGTGAVSAWQLDMPIAENAGINYQSINDIIIQINYTALQGNSTYKEVVTNTRKPLK